jgi:hypothetical protein
VSYQSGSGSMTLERSFGSGGIQRTISVRWTSGAVSSWIACQACHRQPQTTIWRL